MYLKIFLLLWTFATVSAKATMVQGFDVSKAWESAVVYVPSNFLPKRVIDVRVDAPQPVVIFLHGCGGIDMHERRWADHLKSQGFIVVLPDSLAIPGRSKNCDSTTHTTNLGKIPVRELRPAEASYAMARVREQTWADQDNIFLMGHSEGGMTVSRTPVEGFKAVISSGFWCHRRLEIKHGGAPFLFLNWENDPWFRDVPDKRNPQICQQLSEKRASTEQVLLVGQGHATSQSDSAKMAVEKFLKAN
jgi:dienelactone hydrolase